MPEPFDSEFIDGRIDQLLKHVAELPEGSDEQERVEHLAGELLDDFLDKQGIPRPKPFDIFVDAKRKSTLRDRVTALEMRLWLLQQTR